MNIESISYRADDPDCVDRVAAAVEEHGCALVLDLYTGDQLAALQEWNRGLVDQAPTLYPDYWKPGDAVFAIKSVYEICPEAIEMTLTPALVKLLLATSGGAPLDFHAATIMGRTGEHGNRIEWHQDNGIPVDRDLKDERSKGLREGGVPYRFGRDADLERGIECRINIEPQREDGGCLHVFPGSHRWPVADYDGIAEQIGDRPSLPCPAPAGSGLIFRPKLAHMSYPASTPLPDGERRCVLQVQLHETGVELEQGLNWWGWEQTPRITPQGVELV